jgi:hypothetical protein
MPISPKAIEAYLTRDVEELSWIKGLNAKAVTADLKLVKPRVKFTAPLRTDQKICFLLGAAYPEILFMTDLGLGKTVVSLELFNYFLSIGFIRRGIVFCPTDELVESWEDEIKKWGFPFPVVSLRKGSSTQKWLTLATLTGDGLIIGTYTGISAMVSRMVQRREKPGYKGKSRKKREPISELLDKVGMHVDALFFDQSTSVGNTGSLSYRVCKHFSLRAKVRYGLAGRAFGRDPAMIWAQLYLADHGHALGDKFYMFREAFYSKYFPKWGGTEYTLRKKLEPTLARFIASSSLRYSVEECVELPPKVPVLKSCEFPVENWGYFIQERDKLFASRGNFRECRNAFLRMRQISSGFVGFIDDETEERVQIEFSINPKLELLMDIVREVPEDRKCIIFYEFNHSGQKITEALTKEKIKHGWLWGGTKDWTPIKDAFNNDPKYRFLVANWKKAAMGLNLQVGSYALFYESPVGVVPRAEAEGRIHRTGQEHRCFIYDLIVKDSVDELILGFHATGGDLWKALVDNPQKALNLKPGQKH